MRAGGELQHCDDLDCDKQLNYMFYGSEKEGCTCVLKCPLSRVGFVTCSFTTVPFRFFLVTSNYILDLLQEACFPFVIGGSENRSFLLPFLLCYFFNMI